MGTTLFISRSINRDISEWLLIESIGWIIKDQSLIEIKPISIKLPTHISWIFFSSKNAVYHFFTQLNARQLNEVAQLKMGAIGRGTSDALTKFTNRIDYIGDGLFKDKESFLNQVDKTETILFPMAQNSRRYVQRQIGSDRNIIDLIVYDNFIRTSIVPNTDIAILTSPMNAQSFISQYKDDLSKVDMWSIGPATSRCILQQNLKVKGTFSQPLEQIWASEIWSHIRLHNTIKK